MLVLCRREVARTLGRLRRDDRESRVTILDKALPARADRILRVALRGLERACGAALPQLFVPDQPVQRDSQCVHVSGADEQPVATVLDDLAWAGRTVEAD